METCVNALNGLSSFLRTSRKHSKTTLLLCQRPKRALFISTAKQFMESFNDNQCVNALNGLSSFLHSFRGRNFCLLQCVNALNGLSSFLPKEVTREYATLAVCQRPKRALFISTQQSLLQRKRIISVSTP